jgi:AraC family transcriptional regulator
LHLDLKTMTSGLVYLRPTRLAFVRVTGPYETSIPEAWNRLLEWTEQNGFSSPVGHGYGLARDNPLRVSADKCRYEACVPVTPLSEDRAMRELGVITLPGGSYTRVRHAGGYGPMRSMIPALYSNFEAPADLKLDDKRPIVTIYLDDPRRFDDSDLRADICVPVTAARLSRSADKAA